MHSCVIAVCQCLIENATKLNELDRGSGDGDCGSTFLTACTGQSV